MFPLFYLTLVVVSLCIALASVSYWLTGKLKLTKGCGRVPLFKGQECKGNQEECSICGKKGDL